MTLALLTFAVAVGFGPAPAPDDAARPPVESRDGAFVGTLVAADGGSLVVHGDTGQAVTFLLDGRSDMPAGFVTGTRVVVRYEVLPDRAYRAASVSPPRIPLDPDAVTELPPWPEAVPGSAPSPQGGRADEAASERERVSSPEAGRSAVKTLVTYPGPPLDARSRRRPLLERPEDPRPESPAAPLVPAVPTASARPIRDQPLPEGAHRGWLTVMTALLLTCAVLSWRAYTR